MQDIFAIGVINLTGGIDFLLKYHAWYHYCYNKRQIRVAMWEKGSSFCNAENRYFWIFTVQCKWRRWIFLDIFSSA